MNYLASRFGSNANSFRSATPLSDEQIRKIAPSVFADAPHESRSARYTYIPTSDILAGLRKEGFEPFAVMQARSRIEGKSEYTKHMLRLRHAGTSFQAGQQVNEIILLNSHDGTSSYQMMSGVFRVICANGLVSCVGVDNDIRVPHKGDVAGQVIEGAYTVLDSFEEVDDRRQQMQGIKLSEAEKAVFARAALPLRFDEGVAPVTESDVLRLRRRDDNQNDLWTTFNVVQENLVRGGLRGRNANNKPMTTREVTGLDANVKLNRSLWILAEEMRKLRGE